MAVSCVTGNLVEKTATSPSELKKQTFTLLLKTLQMV